MDSEPKPEPKPTKLSQEDKDTLVVLAAKYTTDKVLSFVCAIQYPVVVVVVKRKDATPPPSPSLCVHHHRHDTPESREYNKKHLEEYEANQLRIQENLLRHHKDSIEAITDPADRILLEPMATHYMDNNTVVNYLLYLEDMGYQQHHDAIQIIEDAIALDAIPPDADSVYDTLRELGLLDDLVAHYDGKKKNRLVTNPVRSILHDRNLELEKKPKLLDNITHQITSPYANYNRFLIPWSTQGTDEKKKILVQVTKHMGYAHAVHLTWNFVTTN